MTLGDEPEAVFGPFRLDRRNRSLTRDGVSVPLGGRAFDTLAVLAIASGATVSKEVLLDAVWPGLTVEENNLQVQMSALRRVLGEGWIVTVPGRGYRLALPPSAAQLAVTPAQHARQPPALPDKPSIAVLPFQNLSNDPQQEYFADGIVEDIITGLTRQRLVFVIARNSSFTFKGRAVDVRQVGRELGVRYVLEGSIRRTSDRVRLTAQLVEAATGVQVWAERFDSDIAEIFDLQDRITESVIGAIVPNLERAEIARAQAKPTDSLDAYDLYLRALALYETFSRDDATVAIPMLQRAIGIDPRFTRAKALLALWLTSAVMNGWPPPGGREDGVVLAYAVAASDGDDAEALASAAFAMAFLAHDHATASAAAARALSLNPNSMRVLYFAGRVHAACGEPERAHPCYTRALRINPIDPRRGRLMLGIAEAHLAGGNFEDAVAAARDGLRDQPHYVALLRAIIAALVALGRIDEAKVHGSQLINWHPWFRISQRDYLRQYSDPATAALFLDGLRAAGVPE